MVTRSLLAASPLPSAIPSRNATRRFHVGQAIHPECNVVVCLAVDVFSVTSGPGAGVCEGRR